MRRCSLKPSRPAAAIPRSPKVLDDNMQVVELNESALKDSVLRKIGIPLLRLSTRTETGQEGEKLRSFLLGVHSIRKGRSATVRVSAKS